MSCVHKRAHNSPKRLAFAEVVRLGWTMFQA